MPLVHDEHEDHGKDHGQACKEGWKGKNKAKPQAQPLREQDYQQQEQLGGLSCNKGNNEKWCKTNSKRCQRHAFGISDEFKEFLGIHCSTNSSENKRKGPK